MMQFYLVEKNLGLTLLSTSKSIIEEDGNVKEFVIVQTNSPF
jgi:hypothetical protein